MFEGFIDKAIELLRKNRFKEPIPTVDNGLIISMLRIFTSFAVPANGFHFERYEGDRLKRAIAKALIFSFAWSFGGSIDSQHHSKFEVFLSTEFNLSDLPKGSIFDYYIGPDNDPNLPPTYHPWTQVMGDFQYSKDKSFFELVVPTKDTARFSWHVRRSLNSGFPIFLTGVTGVGKSIIVNSAIEELMNKGTFQGVNLSFSSQTSSLETQVQIEDKLQHRRKNVRAGPNGRKVALFIDDVNMPACDDIGTQPPIELLRQFLDYNAIYNRD